jgi:hypothetical protein
MVLGKKWAWGECDPYELRRVVWKGEHGRKHTKVEYFPSICGIYISVKINVHLTL